MFFEKGNKASSFGLDDVFHTFAPKAKPISKSWKFKHIYKIQNNNSEMFSTKRYHFKEILKKLLDFHSSAVLER